MTSISENIYGSTPFYQQEDFESKWQKERFQQGLTPTAYSCQIDVESKVYKIAKLIFSIIFFPVALYNLAHKLTGLIILPAQSISSKKIEVLKKNWIDVEAKYKRFTVEVDGQKIDAYLVGKPETIQNRRWILASNGNNQSCERMLESDGVIKLMEATNSNGVVFNYPGVGSSPGLATRKSMVKAYKAMLQLLEDEKNGIGATEIIGYGFSLGGAVQGEALLHHSFKEHINYVFIKDRTFSDLSKVVDSLIFRPVGLFVKLLGWNMSPIDSSRALAKPELILQSHEEECVRVCKKTESNSIAIVDDGVISAKASLATALLADEAQYPNKDFIGLNYDHFEPLSFTFVKSSLNFNSPSAITTVADKVNELLSQQSQM